MSQFYLSLNESQIISLLKLLDLTEIKIRGRRKQLPRDHIYSKRKIHCYHNEFRDEKISRLKLAKREVGYIENILNQFLIESIQSQNSTQFAEYFELLQQVANQTYVKNDLLFQMFHDTYNHNDR